MPWDTDVNNRENSIPIDQSGWLGGRTTIPYDHSGEPDNAFMQMATNIAGEMDKILLKAGVYITQTCWMAVTMRAGQWHLC